LDVGAIGAHVSAVRGKFHELLCERSKGRKRILNVAFTISLLLRAFATWRSAALNVYIKLIIWKPIFVLSLTLPPTRPQTDNTNSKSKDHDVTKHNHDKISRTVHLQG
jgi:hypothetical protein